MKCVYNHLFYEWDLIFSCLETIHWVILGHGPYINGLIGQKRNMYYLALTRAEDISRVCATVPLFMKMWRSQLNVRSCKIQGEGLAIYKKKKKSLLPDKHSFVWGQRLDILWLDLCSMNWPVVLVLYSS